MFVRENCLLLGLALVVASAGETFAADDYLGSVVELSRSLEEYRPPASQDPEELGLLLQDLRAEITRPRFLSPDVLRQLGREIRAKAAQDDSDVVKLLASIDGVVRWVELGGPKDWARYCRVRADEVAGSKPIDMVAERHNLSLQLGRSSQFLATAPADIRRDWEEYLFWDETKGLASSDAPTDETLDRLETRWANSSLALDSGSLATTSIAMQRFSQLQRRAAGKRTGDDWARLLREAADLLERMGDGDLPNDRLVAIVVELERNGVTCELGNAVRRRYSQPNAMLVVSTENLARKSNVALDEEFEVNGIFGGVQSRGKGRLSGKFWCEAFPSPSVARWMWRIDAVSQSHSTASQQRVTVTSRGVTGVHALKLFQWGPTGLATLPTQVRAAADVDLENIDAGGPLRRSIATNRAYATLPEAERDAAAEAERSVKQRLDAEGSRLLGQVATAYDREYRVPAALCLDAVSTVVTRATERECFWECHYEPLDTIAVRLPPVNRSGDDARICLHESFVSGFLADRLCGKKMTGRHFADTFAQSMGSRNKDASRSTEWHVRWSKKAPISCTFRDGVLRVVLRTDEICHVGRDLSGVSR